MKHFAVWSLVLLCVTESARAADPALARVMPRGATRGTEVELTLTGNNLADAQEILFYDAGITVKELKPQDPRTVKAKVAVAPHARLGEYRLRVRTATGISPIRTLFAGALPIVDEQKEPNDSPATAQKIDLNVTLAGVMENESVEHFAVEAKQGQRITAEVEGMRLSTAIFDPFLAILDADGKELVAQDDAALHLQDPVVSLIAPKDGRYVIRVRDSAYGGSDQTAYRLHVGTFPRPTAVYPAGGQPGQDVNVQFLGDVAGPFSQSIKLPAETLDRFEVFAEQNGQLAPSGNAFRVNTLNNVLESEPNDSPDKASSAGHELPLALNGIIEKAGDVDVFRFTARKGQQFHVQCFARRVRSPLDPVMSIDRAGKNVAANDDNGGPDSYVRFAVPEDGEYTLSVRDHLRGGGADFVYRIEIIPAAPALALSIPFYDQNNSSQERQAIVVPRGNRVATLVRAQRVEFGGEVAITTEGLPDGITMNAESVADGVDSVPVVFEAKPDAPIAGRLVELSGKPVKGDVNVKGLFFQAPNLVPNGNDPPFYTTHVDRLAVAVAEEAPFKLSLVQPKVPLVQGGSMQLKVVAERKAGFDGPIRLQMIYNPPGVSAAGNAEIEPGKTEGFIALNAADNAQANKWRICVIGAGEPESGRVWCSTQLAELDVAAPLLAMSIQMSTVERGKSGQVVVNVEEKTPLATKAKVKLVGLPANVTATPDEVELSPGDKTVKFNVTTTDKAPVGQHNGLLCVATVTKDGEPIMHNLARGGVLRVDAPPPPEKAAAQAKGEPPKPNAVAANRLEQLRQQAAAKNAK